MALYFGSNKVNVNLNGMKYRLNINLMSDIKNDARLLSSDGYILKDLSGLCLMSNDSKILNLQGVDNYG